MFGPIIDEKLSRTFSISSSESSIEIDDERHLSEIFADEGFGFCARSGNGNSSRSIVAAPGTNSTPVMVAPRTIPDLRVPLEIARHDEAIAGKTSSSSSPASGPHSKSSFLIESMVRRDETKTRFVMYQQSMTTGAVVAQPVFCAEKYPPADGGQILIKSIAPAATATATATAGSSNGDAVPILGSLMKQKKKRTERSDIGTRDKKLTPANTSTTTYELFLHAPAVATTTTATTTTTTTAKTNRKKPSKAPLVVATIEYERVGRIRYFVEGGHPRSARVRICGKGGGNGNGNSGGSTNGDGDGNSGGGSDAWAESKEPSVRSSDGQRVLGFGGRGRETSSKNMQLVRSDGCDGGDGGSCCLQMVKWKDHEFNLDFGPPFDAFHAFAFALAQFDF